MSISRQLTALLVVACCCAVAAQSSQPAESVAQVAIPVKFPAIGNIEGVVQWRIGRLEDVSRAGGDDIALRIRMADRTVTVTGPGPQFAELASKSDWLRSGMRSMPGRSDYAERVIAFDYDPQMRLIAMASLEPIDRDRTRLRRALGGF